MLRQCVHQVQIEIIEAGILRGFHRAQGIATAVDAAQPLQAAVIKTLHTKTQAIDASGKIAGKWAVLHRAGVGFQCDFGIGRKPQPGAGLLQKPVDGRGREQ